ncbi:hypothetical protein [Butyrivibrio sp. JL13D10]|uniref:hypothetical protein n=1 Tax=Butyrivibrio sp. JL13D10 TaxID=3236815 RepID=UPI0038B4CAE4
MQLQGIITVIFLVWQLHFFAGEPKAWTLSPATPLYISKAIKDGIAASNKRSGRKQGQLDKLSPELRDDIKKYLQDRSIKQIDLMNKHGVSRNTLKKYIEAINENGD